MNDPWDVKSVRHSSQYVSCMRLNGVPLLPPVISKECRKEMQYYKLLAKEVEKRLQYQTDSEADDITDAPDIPEYEQSYEHIPTYRSLKDIDPAADPILESLESSNTCSPILNLDSNTIKEEPTSVEIMGNIQNTDVPERDYNCIHKIIQKVRTPKQLLIDAEISRSNKKEVFKNGCHYSPKSAMEPIDTTQFHSVAPDGPSSLGSKSFTGSLNDLYSESIKDQLTPKLIRQRSYTLLNPSPQLLAHLEVQSLNTGVEMTAISMSESMSNLSTPHRKRRNWDLETAKEKWSSMAMELKRNDFVCGMNKTGLKPQMQKKSPPFRAKSLGTTPSRKTVATPRATGKSEASPKSEPLPKKKHYSPETAGNSTFVKVPLSSPKPASSENQWASSLVSDSEDPASKVRELYEKIQKQQMIQMATLIEKQKREQIMLQQVFEEQNNMLFKQLKNICPKSPIEAKQAWEGDADRGPVSLSQLINCKSPEQSSPNSPMSSTLIDTNQYISQCDQVLKQSRDITESLKKQSKPPLSNGRSQSPRQDLNGSRTRTHSPTHRTSVTPRRLNYDTSSEPYEPLLTDRTNDTLADLNVTFPSDSDVDGGFHKFNNSLISQLCDKEYKTSLKSDNTTSGIHSRVTEDAIRNIEKTIHDSICRSATIVTPLKKEPTPKERAAATIIVAHVKGYLVRRLMKTERVQGTVQTIKDALLCALQLHQEREGIRGADVDLHRRLIQQITAACYSLHETFIASSAADRCSLIAADRSRRRSLANRQSHYSHRPTDIMSQSHSGVFPIRAKRAPPSPMTQSNYETFSADKQSPVSRRYMSSPRRRPWR